MEGDDDCHMCIVCHTTIFGLHNYLNHRKTECRGGKQKLGSSSMTETPTDLITSVSFKLEDSIATPSEENTLDTNVIQHPTKQEGQHPILIIQPASLIQTKQLPGSTSQSQYVFPTISNQEEQISERKKSEQKIDNILDDVQFNGDLEEFLSDVDDVMEYSDDERESAGSGTRQHTMDTDEKLKSLKEQSEEPHTEGKQTKTWQNAKHKSKKTAKTEEFYCPVCQKKSSTKYTFVHHLVSSHHGNKNKESIYLDEKWQTLLLSHQPMQCRICRFFCKATDVLTDHINTDEHTRKAESLLCPQYCVTCNFVTYDTDEMLNHFNSDDHLDALAKSERVCVLKEKRKDIHCKFCQEQCHSAGILTNHIKVHHSEIEQKNNEVSLFETETGGVIQTESQYQESVAGNVCLGIHELFHDLVGEIRKDRNNKFECPECSQTLRGVNMLPHIRAHSNFFPFECPCCNNKFTSSPALKRHYQCVHLSTTIHPCSHCDKQFKRKHALAIHEATVHRDKVQIESKFTCDQCGERFARKEILTSHVKYKHERKQIACSYSGCRLRFKTNSELQVHLRVHTGEKPYLCDICGFAATCTNYLNRHRRKHFDQPPEKYISCKLCEYKTRQAGHLRRHMRTHTGSKPFKCPYCEHRCNNISNIRKHILESKLHPGKPLYPCSDCDFGTAKLKDLLDHRYTIHSHPVSHVKPENYYMFNNLYDKEADAVALGEDQIALSNQ